MAQIDILEDVVVPESPRTVDNEQLFVYVPIATYDNKGIASFSPDDFIVEKGDVTLKYSGRDIKNDIDKTAADIASLNYELSKSVKELSDITKEHSESLVEVFESFPNKADLIGGKVPTSQLPSYVDDVLEYDTKSDFPIPGEKGKIYFELEYGNAYRWTGTTYVKFTDLSAIENELKNKLDKYDKGGKGSILYGVTDDGEQAMFLSDRLPIEDTIAIRDENGNVKTNRPVENNDAINKFYGHNTFANAIKGNVSGSAVAMKEVSPLEHELDVKVSSKNLIPYPYVDKSVTQNGGTITANDDGGVTCSGIPTDYVGFVLCNNIPLAKNTVYCLSAQGTHTGTVTSIALYNFNNEYIETIGLSDKYNQTSTTIDTSKYNGDVFASVSVKRSEANVEMTGTIYLQLEKGTVATSYAPYIEDISSVEVKRYGKNLLLYPYRVITETRNGITIADNGDGARTFDGTATSLVDFHLGFINVRNGVQYTISSNLTGSSPSTYQLWFRSKGGGVGDYYGIEKRGVTFTPTTDDIIEVFLYIYKDTTVNNMVFKPQLEVGTTATPYEPYIEPTTYQVEADGTVKGIMSLYPSTTLVTDNRALIECEYNRDINKAFEELRQIIISLGGNI